MKKKSGGVNMGRVDKRGGKMKRRAERTSEEKSETKGEDRG